MSAPSGPLQDMGEKQCPLTLKARVNSPVKPSRSDQPACGAGHDATVFVRLGSARRPSRAESDQARSTARRTDGAPRSARNGMRSLGVRDEAWGQQTEPLSPIEQTLTAQPMAHVTALALPRTCPVCSPSRAQVVTNRR